MATGSVSYAASTTGIRVKSNGAYAKGAVKSNTNGYFEVAQINSSDILSDAIQQINVTNTNSSDTFYPTFAASASNGQTMYIDSVTGPLSYIPSTCVMTLGATSASLIVGATDGTVTVGTDSGTINVGTGATGVFNLGASYGIIQNSNGYISFDANNINVVPINAISITGNMNVLGYLNAYSVTQTNNTLTLFAQSTTVQLTTGNNFIWVKGWSYLFNVDSYVTMPVTPPDGFTYTFKKYANAREWAVVISNNGSYFSTDGGTDANSQSITISDFITATLIYNAQGNLWLYNKIN